MHIVQRIQDAAVVSLSALYEKQFTVNDFQVNQTKTEFTGDYTIVLFSLLKTVGKSPDALGNELGQHLLQNYPHLFSGYNLIKGFLNLEVQEAYWLSILEKNYADKCFGKMPMNGKKVMVEYSSPNTNKPLHLGHLRNNFLGWSVAEILKANGNEVLKSCIVNDRGIHICKSMIAWQRFADGATPESTGMKGDHFVGEYYVKFNDAYKAEVKELESKGLTTKEAEQEAPIMKATQQMLSDWEAGKPEVIDLWRRMNSWVYAGFDVTYKNIGSDFDKIYYESDTYLLGKDIVNQGLANNTFYKKEDGSVWIDLTNEGLDEKLVLRKDGTSVYITQDIGLAKQKYEQYGIDENIYVIGDEQNYHMKVLKLIAQKLGLPKADQIQHLSYGMVELPSGKMKSREGTVVDADDIVQEMENEARQKTEELGKVSGFTETELAELYHTIGVGALKFFLLRVDPKKKMIFNPEESIDFHGFTGPFIQFNHARICSILDKNPIDPSPLAEEPLLAPEKELLVSLERFPAIISQAAQELNPSAIAIYVYQVAKSFSSLYAELSIASAETPAKKQLRLRLASMTAMVIHSGMQLLGITVPARM